MTIKHLKQLTSALEEYCNSIVDENKALRLLLSWAIECDFGFDNFQEEYERYKKDIEYMDYKEGMIYIAKKVIEEGNESNIRKSIY